MELLYTKYRTTVAAMLLFAGIMFGFTQKAKAQCTTLTHTSFSTFNSSANAGTATSLWLNVRVKLSGELTAHGDVLYFTNGTLTLSAVASTPTITNTSFPSGKIIAENTCTAPYTEYNGTMWITHVPLNYSNSDVFITAGIFNSSNGFVASSGKASTVKGNLYSNKTVAENWFYGISCYQPQFAYTAVDGSGDVASVSGTYGPGTPVPKILTLKSGGTGTGGSNYTGNTSSKDNFTACYCAPPSTPPAITGTMSVCSGATTQLSNTTSGGTWYSSSSTVATISSTGLVTAVWGGTSYITYTVTNSCGSTASVTSALTVNAVPILADITGSSSVCPAATITLYNSTSGGTWASSNTAAATISSSGVVTGVAGGTTNITYSKSNSCGTATVTKVVTVPMPITVAEITGSSAVCKNSTITLSCATPGGTWYSDDPSIATITTSGVVTGVATGRDSVYYYFSNGCSYYGAYKIIEVQVLPVVPAITGSTSVCAGATTTLANTTAGGAWSSSNTATATVSSAGVVTGVAAGSATISYAVTNSCGTTTVTKALTISAQPTVAAIAGASTVCVGQTTTLTDATTGGVWSSNNIAIATVSSTGVVTGVASGGVTISYMYTSTCSRTVTKGLTVNNRPTVPDVQGANSVNAGFATTLTDSVLGGTWASLNTAIATVTSGGIVTGVAAGSTTITYSVTNSCGATVKNKAMAVTNRNPVAVNDTVSTLFNTPVNCGVLTNDVAGSAAFVNSTLAFVSGTTPASSVGVFTANIDGTITFVPASTFSGTTSVQYRISDLLSQSTTATLVVNVAAQVIVDTDHDGAPDAIDEFPNDQYRAFNNNYPATGYSSLMFEDNWPYKGDYDFNDLVVDYKFNTITNASNQVVEARYTFVMKCAGAGLHNGFAFQIDNVSPAKVTSVSGAKTHAASWVSNGANGTENGQTSLNVIVFDDAYKVMTYPGSGHFLNTDMDAPKVAYDTTQIVVTFINNGTIPTGGPVTISGFPSSAFNPYIILGDSGSFSQDRTREVHLPDRMPSSKMSNAYWGKGNDNSDPSRGRYYRTANNLPWVLNISTAIPYMQEYIDISEGYSNFLSWAISNGTTNLNWYLDLSGNRNISKLYNK